MKKLSLVGGQAEGKLVNSSCNVVNPIESITLFTQRVLITC